MKIGLKYEHHKYMSHQIRSCLTWFQNLWIVLTLTFHKKSKHTRIFAP